jgi:hypothetical protein
VRISVELDDQALGSGDEIGDVRSEDGLLLEFDAETVGAEAVPEAAFGLGELLAQVLGAGSRFDVPFYCSAPSPRSAALTRPLPLKGVRGLDRHIRTPAKGSPVVNA